MTRWQFLWYAKRVLLSLDVGITYNQVSLLFQCKYTEFSWTDKTFPFFCACSTIKSACNL